MFRFGFEFRNMFLILLVCCGLHAQTVLGQEDQQVDPTIPSPSIREKLEPAAPQQPTRAAVPTQEELRSSPVALDVPRVKTKSMVLGENFEGFAVLEVDGESYGMRLPSEKYRKRVVIPPNQFGGKQHRADNGSDEAQNDEASSTEATPESILDTQTIQIGSSLLTCVSYSQQLIVLRDIYSGRLILSK